MPAGRPKKEIDPKQVELLASCFCTQEEVADHLGCSVDTIQRNFAAEYIKGHNTAKSKLKLTQFKLAQKSAAMAIFLGKNYLGQSDRYDFSNLSDADLIAAGQSVIAGTATQGADENSKSGE